MREASKEALLLTDARGGLKRERSHGDDNNRKNLWLPRSTINNPLHGKPENFKEGKGKL